MFQEITTNRSDILRQYWIENCTALVEDYQGTMRLVHYSDRLHWHEEILATKSDNHS